MAHRRQDTAVSHFQKASSDFSLPSNIYIYGVRAASWWDAVRKQVVSYLSEKQKQNKEHKYFFTFEMSLERFCNRGDLLLRFRNEWSFLLGRENITESDERSLTLDIHAFGLDKNELSQNPIIYIFVYRTKLEHINTSRRRTKRVCDGMPLFFFFFLLQWRSIAAFQEHVPKWI